MAAEKITTGAWSARWGEWQVHLQLKPTGWSVVVWSWPDGESLSARKRLGGTASLRSAEVAIDWASSLLKQQGARVFISGREQPLSKFLAFSPAPEDVP